jgi:hypothetical protein
MVTILIILSLIFEFLLANCYKQLGDGKETFFLSFYTNINGENALEYNNVAKLKGALLNNHDPRPDDACCQEIPSTPMGPIFFHQKSFNIQPSPMLH